MNSELNMIFRHRVISLLKLPDASIQMEHQHYETFENFYRFYWKLILSEHGPKQILKPIPTQV